MDAFRFDPPDLSEAEAAAIAADLYGVTGEALHLRGERSHNTRFTTADGEQFVLRVASASEPDAVIEFHAGALAHLNHVCPELPVATVITAADGRLVPSIERRGLTHRLRLETFLPGTTFDDDQLVSSAAMSAIGRLLGGVAAGLASYAHPAAADFMPWDIANGLILDDALWDGLGADARAIVERARPRLESATEAMERLPRQIVHNDGHAGNLLRADARSELVTGLIDFGDLVHTVTAADIAVCGASLAPHQTDPAGALAALTAGYHVHRPLAADEVAALPALVLARLVLSTLMIDYQLANSPHMVDAVTPERVNTLANLERWLALDPTIVTERINEELS